MVIFDEMQSYWINITDIPTLKYNNIVSLCSEYYDNGIFTSLMRLNLCILDESLFCFKINKTELFSNIINPFKGQILNKIIIIHLSH